MISIPTVINFYYTLIMAYSVYYLFMGLNTDLPWSRCNDDSFNTLNCYSLLDAESCTETQLYWNRTCTEIDDFSKQVVDLLEAGYPGCVGCGGPGAEGDWNEEVRRASF